MTNSFRKLMHRSWDPRVAAVMQRAKVRDSFVLLAALLVVLGVIIHGIQLWPLLPDKVPARWLSLSTFLSSLTQLPLVPKTVASVFGEIALGFFLLPLYWFLIQSNLLSAMMTWMRSQSVQFKSEYLAALEVCFLNDFFTWFVSWIALKFAIDTQQLWYLSLHRNASSLTSSLNLMTVIAVFGFLFSFAFNWYRLSRLDLGK